MRKQRSDKGEDRLNTRSKYLIYSSISLIAGLAYGYSQSDTQTVFQTIRVPYEVVKEVEVIEYVPLPCKSVTKDAQ